MSVRFLFVALVMLLAAVARGQGTYQPTRNGKTLVWNNNPKAGDEATWSGGRDRNGYARGFGTLTWYTKEAGFGKPQLYALYWGNMVEGKFNGPVNLHSKKKTDHAIFADGTRVTRWSPGTAPSRMTQQEAALIAEHKAAPVREPEPEAPAAGPVERNTAAAIPKSRPELAAARPVERPSASAIPESEPEPPAAGPATPRSEDTDQGPEANDSIQDLQSESRPKIDIDDSIRILVWPPRSLRDIR